MVQEEISKLVKAIGLLSRENIFKKQYQMGISIVIETDQAWSHWYVHHVKAQIGK